MALSTLLRAMNTDVDGIPRRVRKVLGDRRAEALPNVAALRKYPLCLFGFQGPRDLGRKGVHSVMQHKD